MKLKNRIMYRYGKHPSEYIYVYTPERLVASTKIFFLIHGGFWKEKFDLSLMEKLAEFLFELNHIVVNVEYPRVGGTTYHHASDVVKGIFKAYDFTNRFYPELPRIVVGHSAGGQLGTLLGMRSELEVLPTKAKKIIMPKMIVSLAGVLDLWRGYVDLLSDDHDAVWNFIHMNRSGTLSKKDFDSLSPMTYEPECEVHLIHGHHDVDVPIDYSRAFHQKWKNTGKVFFHPEQTHHMGMILPQKPFWRDLIKYIDE
ncbi:MAG: alpha/beta hydrolase [Candidatus Pacebacteria bacterium]|nr:alpha/beta hydrolase [Candidatus Paceibacterota bacterium]